MFVAIFDTVQSQLAEYNLARLRSPLDSPENAEFAAVLEAINQIAESSPGFVWRLTGDDERSSSYVQVYDDPLLIVNYSVWTDLNSLRHFTYRSGHSAYLRRRREWFETGSNRMVCWWTPADVVPTIEEARRRLEHLDRHGATADAFTLSTAYEADGTPE